MYKRLLQHGRPAFWVSIVAMTVTAVPWRSAGGYTPESPKVRQAVARAIDYLGSDAERAPRLGARALVGLAVLKHGAKQDHPKVVAAVKAIQEAIGEKDPADFGVDLVYDKGLAIIFLVTLDPGAYATEIQFLIEALGHQQKPHGGWGYTNRKTGDTSMTQYAVLSSWEASQAGFNVPIESIERVATWLLKTQDPSGAFGYQGVVSNSFTPVKQDKRTLSLTAAGLGSLYICTDLLGLIQQDGQGGSDLPAALKRIKEKNPQQAGGRVRTQLDPRLFRTVQARGNAWIDQNYKINPTSWPYYYLYALERYKSFREFSEGGMATKPAADGAKWYNDGVEFLLESQLENGTWRSNVGGLSAGTAFGALFLMRSTRTSIEKVHNFGGGMMIGARGLPKETGRAEMRGGKVVAKPLLGPAEELLAAINSTGAFDYQRASNVLAELPPHEAEALTKKYAEKLRRLVGNKSPEARITAVRALAKNRNLDNVPTLIYALTDPDPVVLREARNALRRISRKPAGFGMPDPPNKEARLAAIHQWKAWYLAIRPDAQFEH